MAKSDSLLHGRIQFTHYYSQDQWSSTNFLRIFDNRHKFEPANGISVFNIVRAQVPNLVMSPSVLNPLNSALSTGINISISQAGYLKPPYSALRTGITTSVGQVGYLVDGVGFNAGIGNYYNLNAFEFEAISIASSANSLVLFDLPATGAMLLKSRDGSGYDKATFEYNSYFTGAWSDNGSGDEFWLTSNSLAYMQDLGKVDLRMSYNLGTESSKLAEGVPLFHSIKVNTGFDFSNRLKARLLVDDRFNAKSRTLHFSQNAVNETTNQNFFQSNLTGTYRALDWLDLSGQLVVAVRDSSAERSYDNYSRKQFVDDDRTIWNLFANFHRKIGADFFLNGLAGFQSTATSGCYSITTVNGSNQSAANISQSNGSHSLVGGADVAFRDLLNLSFQYKNIAWDSVSSGERSRPAYSMGVAYNFSRMLGLKQLKLGRLRMSYGEVRPAAFTSYPRDGLALPGAGNLAGTWEFGTDLGLVRSILDFSVNYFYSSTDSQIKIPHPFIVVTLSQDLIENGWEFMLRYHPGTDRQFKFSSNLVFSTFTSRWEQYAPSPSLFIRTGLFNEIRWNNSRLSILLEHTNSSATRNYETNSLKLREISFTSDFNSFKTKSAIKQVSFSLVGRNLVEFSSVQDIERLFGYRKSISLGLSFVL